MKGFPAGYIIMISNYEEAVSLMKVITGGNPPMGVTRTSWAAKMTRPRVPAQSLSQTGGPGQGIALRTGFFALDWTLRFTRTTVTVDGNQHQIPPGRPGFLPGTGRRAVAGRRARQADRRGAHPVLSIAVRWLRAAG